MSAQRGIKLLYQANAPWCPTGYGTQSKHILPALIRMPEVEDIVIFAFYGLQGGRIPYRMGGHTFQVVPTTQDDWGNSHVSEYALEFGSDIVITLMDIWPLSEQYGQGFRWAPYMPLDSETVQGDIAPAVQTRLRNSYLPIVYSEYGDALLTRLGYEHAYAAHGVDTRRYTPRPAMKRKYRQLFGMPEEAVNGTVFGMVAANKGFPARKGFPEAFEAFSRIRDKVPNAWLYLHTIADGSQGGPDLKQMAEGCGIGDRLIASTKHLQLSGAFDDEDMVRLYNCFDVLLQPSYSEGFGIPLVEAQSCGIPVVTTDAFAMTELCGSGWLIPWDHRFYLPLGTNYVMPQVSALADAMVEAVTLSAKGRKEYRERARAFGLQYDWQRIIDQQWRPLIQRLHRELVPRTYRISGFRSNGHAPADAARELVAV